METLSNEDLRRLAAPVGGPCLTVYAALTPGRADENKTRLGALAARAAASLGGLAEGADVARILAPLRRVVAGEVDIPAGEGLAHFASPDTHATVALRVRPPESVAVQSVFVIRPLLSEVCEAAYFLLALSHREAALYHGTAAGLSRVEVPGMPEGIEGALRTHDSDEPLTLHSFRRDGAEAIFHGHGVGIDDHKDDLVRYFRAIDRALHPVLRDESDPLVLAGVAYLFPLYAKANTYPHLRPVGVQGNPDHATATALHRAAWPLVVEGADTEADRNVNRFHKARGAGRAAYDVRDVVEMAVAGGVETLLLTPGARAWGRYVLAEHRAGVNQTPVSGDDELWNFAAVHVLRHRGNVYEVNAGALGVPEAGAILRVPVAAHA